MGVGALSCVTIVKKKKKKRQLGKLTIFLVIYEGLTQHNHVRAK